MCHVQCGFGARRPEFKVWLCDQDVPGPGHGPKGNARKI